MPSFFCGDIGIRGVLKIYILNIDNKYWEKLIFYIFILKKHITISIIISINKIKLFKIVNYLCKMNILSRIIYGRVFYERV